MPSRQGERTGAGVAAAAPAPSRQRATWRAVAVPAEHGGWGLTAEPALLGMLIAPSIAGLLLGLAVVVAFIARTPLRVVLVDSYRHRSRDRTRLAAAILAGELVVLAGLVAGAVALAETPFWWPLAGAVPLVAVELWFDLRSRSRRLVPELAGAVGVGSVAAMAVAATGQPWQIALGAWSVMAARSVTSIPAVRARIAELHGRPVDARTLVVSDVAAAVLAVAAVALEPSFVAGAIAVCAVVVVQRATAASPAPPKVLGMRQMALGLFVTLVTAIGVRLL